jgi:hypothetical protein
MSEPLIVTPTPTHVHGYKIEQAVIYFDESGQLRARPGQVGVVANLCVPANGVQLRALRDLVATIKQRVLSRANPPKRVKAKHLTEEDYALVADAIRERWVFGHLALTVEETTQARFRETWAFARQTWSEKRRELGSLAEMDLRLDMTERQFDAVSEREALYLALLFSLLRSAAQWFHDNKILPVVRAYLDEKLPRTSTELLGYMLRLPFFTTFPEVFEGRLGELMGAVPTPGYACEVSTDDEQDGLVIADAIAYAASRVARKDDPNGMYLRVLDRMNAERAGEGAA